jgi:hypothetical protein
MMTRLARKFVVVAMLFGAATSVLADPASDRSEPKSLSDAQVAAVVKSHLDEVNACWKRLPPRERAADTQVVLALSIAPKGEICDMTLITDAPADARTCIADAVHRWTFPAAELASDIEYPIALRAR